MPEGFKVNLAKFNDAKAAVDQAARHYGGLADELDRNTQALRDDAALTGGFGVTGHFQNLLAEFGREWLSTMNKFAADERKFVAFLQGFSTRLQETHSLYNEIETRHTGNFEEIGRSIGGEH